MKFVPRTRRERKRWRRRKHEVHQCPVCQKNYHCVEAVVDHMMDSHRFLFSGNGSVAFGLWGCFCEPGITASSYRSIVKWHMIHLFKDKGESPRTHYIKSVLGV